MGKMPQDNWLMFIDQGTKQTKLSNSEIATNSEK